MQGGGRQPVRRRRRVEVPLRERRRVRERDSRGRRGQHVGRRTAVIVSPAAEFSSGK
jgi:hypothetical protein